MLNILITGANGFVGSFLVRALTARGQKVACLLRPGSDVSGLVGQRYEPVAADVTDAASLARVVEGRDVVFHLAGVRRAANREDFFKVNAEGTRLLCEALVALPGARKPRLVLAGSLGASGPSLLGRPKVEEEPLQPVEWYGESKAEAERIVFSYADRLPVTVVRPPRIVGPGDRENLLLFKLVARGLRLELGGGPRPLTLVDVEDVVDLLLLVAERDEALGQAFFVGHPQPLTLEDLQGLVADALGVRPRTLRLSPSVLTALASVADGVTHLTGRRLPLNRKFAQQLLAPGWTCSGAKAERLLGFRATRNPADSIRRSAQWYREHGWLWGHPVTSPQDPLAVVMLKKGPGSRAEMAPGDRASETVLRHRGGNRQVELIDGQRWHLPRGMSVKDIPAEDKVGDLLQEAVTKAAKKWGRDKLSRNERDAIDEAQKQGGEFFRMLTF